MLRSLYGRCIFKIRNTKKQIDVKIFGGANIIVPKIKNDYTGSFQMGARNIDAAKVEIKKLGMTIKSMDVGGKESRRVYFYTDSGEVYLRRSSRKNK